MAIIPHRINNFDDEFFKIIKKAESFYQQAYYNNGDTPTIGVGFALFDKKSKTLNTDIIAAMKRAGVVISATDKQILNDIEVAFKAGKLTTVDTLTDRLAISISENQAKAVFLEIKETYAEKIKNAIGISTYNSLLDSNELIALIDIAYNGVIGSNLASAVKNDNRAEAWFQMRYMSNGGESYKLYGTGIANRRISESNRFNLTQPNMTEDDYKQIMRMYTLHKDKIYEVEHDNTIPKKNSTPVKSEYEKDGLINTKISPARDYLIAKYSEGINIDGDVQVGKGLESYAYLENGDYNDTLTGTSKNDLIFGERGNDTLIGGDASGNDDQTADFLSGGTGFDTYYAGNGDTILDEDGVGKVYFKGDQLTGGVFDEDTTGYTSYRGNGGTYYVIKGINNLLFVDANGESVTLQHFQNSQLEINLIRGDMPPAPPPPPNPNDPVPPPFPNPNDPVPPTPPTPPTPPIPDANLVTVHIHDASASEKAQEMVFAVTLNKALDADITLSTNIGSTTIKKGATSGKIIYTWQDDTIQEPDEVFHVSFLEYDYRGKYNLSFANHAKSATATILDDDRPPIDPTANADFDAGRHDPLVLDLDGDGIETVGISATTHILFDHNNDGIATGTGWVKGDDGLLVLDRNGNGVIDNGSELFGDATTVNGVKATDGFSALRAEDTNARHPEFNSGSKREMPNRVRHDGDAVNNFNFSKVRGVA